ncbi:MAG TPA: hypothetical protein VGM03_17795 [Phycisphaerae bacterium]
MLQYLRAIPIVFAAGYRRVDNLFSAKAGGATAEAGAAWKFWVKGGSAVVLLVAAGAIYAWRSSQNEGVTSRWDYTTRLQCLACKHEFVANLNVSDEPPYKCEKCKQSAAWRLRKCNDCGNVFCPEPSGDPPRQPIIPVCPKCNSGSTGAAPLESK